MIKIVYPAFLSFETLVLPPLVKFIPVIQEFVDVFPTDLLRVPLDRDIDFAIDVKTNT